MNDPLAPQKPALSGDALARRRLLLRGASGSAAALAALQPGRALAGDSVVLTCMGISGKKGLCSVSGVRSAAHSFGPNVTSIDAIGKSKAYWVANANASAWPVGTGTKIEDVFGTGTSFTGKTLLYVLTSKSSTIEADFVCAYLNGGMFYAASPSASKAFPYSASDVQKLWAAGGNTRTDAQFLFSKICIAS